MQKIKPGSSLFRKLLITLILSIPLFFDSNAQNMNNNKSVATFGSGCFWCSEAIFSRLEGVLSVTSGYAGGEEPNPSYELICTGESGYAEVIQIVFNPNIISFQELLEVFWQTHDPTTLNRQGADVGTQYRSVIFFHDKLQKEEAIHFRHGLQKAKIWKNPIVTEISPLQKFYPAEKYHQDFYENNPAQGYCNFVITPKIKKFEQVFSEKLKK